MQDPLIHRFPQFMLNKRIDRIFENKMDSLKQNK